MIKSILDIDVSNKKVLVRVDFNVPIKNGEITSTTRVDEAKETINYLVSNNAKVILCSHLGRPDGKKDKKYSLKPVYEYLKQILSPTKVHFVADCIGDRVKTKADSLKAGEVLLLENLRFYAEEELNDVKFAKKLASLADIYVNDAFGTAHRKHASTYGVCEFLPSCCGFLIKKELDAFAHLDNPQRPFVAILGGAKIADKLAVTENLLNKVDALLIGGGMAYTFLKAQGKNIGTSIVSSEQLEFCKNVLTLAKEKGVKIVLPQDVVCAKDMKETNTIKTFNVNKIPADMGGFDIGRKTIKSFAKIIKKAKTVVWNGPLGVYEMKEYSTGTNEVVKLLAKNKNCYSIIGGGDVVSAIEKSGLQNKISHISTGGGASLKLIEGSTLAGISALSDKPKTSKTVAKKPTTKKTVATKKTTKKLETEKPKAVKKQEELALNKIKKEIKTAVNKASNSAAKKPEVKVPAKTTTITTKKVSTKKIVASQNTKVLKEINKKQEKLINSKKSK